jgi:competence protein ComEC
MYPLLCISTAFLLGLVLNGTFQCSWMLWAGGFFISLALSILEMRFLRRWQPFQRVRTRLPLPLGVILCALFLGGLRFPTGTAALTPHDLPSYNGSQVTLIGMISDAPSHDPGSQSFPLQVESLELEGGVAVEVHGLVRVQTTPAADWHYGDRLRLAGHLNPVAASSSPSYRSYLERQGITSLLYYPQMVLLQPGAGSPLRTAVFALRGSAYRTTMRMFPQPEGALFTGILLGMVDELPDSLVQAYQATGTAHIFAISGFNIAIVAGVFTFLFRRWFTRWPAAVLAIGGIAFYTLLVGASPSVLRAAIMGSLGIVACLIGRRGASLTTLAFTAAIMCAINPHLPWDVSFQLSFMATLGLMLFADPLERGLQGWLAKRLPAEKVRAWSQPIAEYFLLTLAAQAMTLPVLAYHFHRLSLSGLLTNPLVLPAQPMTMILGGLAVLMGMFFFPLGRLLAWLAWPLAAYTNRVVMWLAGLPGDLALGSLGVGTVLSLYVLVFLMLGFLRKWRQHLTQGSLLLVAGLACLLVWRAVLTAPDGLLNVTLFALQDDSTVLIQTPGGNRVLLNGSPAYTELGTDLDARSSLFRRGLDAVIIGQPGSARLNGLESLLQDVPVRHVYWTMAVDSRAAERVVAALLQAGGDQEMLEEGSQLAIDSGVVLSAPLCSQDGSALLITYKNLAVLIPNGVPLESLEQIFDPTLRNVNVLLLTDEDLVATPPGSWDALRMLVLWAEPLIKAPREEWVSLYRREWITLATDGQGVWLTGQ